MVIPSYGILSDILKSCNGIKIPIWFNLREEFHHFNLSIQNICKSDSSSELQRGRSKIIWEKSQRITPNAFLCAIPSSVRISIPRTDTWNNGYWKFGTITTSLHTCWWRHSRHQYQVGKGVIVSVRYTWKDIPSMGWVLLSPAWSIFWGKPATRTPLLCLVGNSGQ